MPASKVLKKNCDESKTKQAIEYSVYIHLPANQNNQFWEKTGTTHDAELALEQAEMLYYSQKYPKVEVMRKFFCEKRKKRVSESFKTFEDVGAQPIAFSKYLRRLWNTISRFIRYEISGF